MISITEEQKELLAEAKDKKDFYKLKILENYIVKLLQLNLPKKFILELIKKEARISIKYSNFLHFVNKHLNKNKRAEKKEKEIEIEMNEQEDNNLLDKLNSLKNTLQKF